MEALGLLLILIGVILIIGTYTQTLPQFVGVLLGEAK